MKNKNRFSTPALVLFITGLALFLTDYLLYYINVITEGWSFDAIDFVEFIIGFSGFVLLIIGVSLAKKGKMKLLYPLGFAASATSYLISAIVMILQIQSVNKIYLIRNVLVVSAFVLLAVDSFLQPRKKVMGIIGAAIIISVMLSFLLYNLFDDLSFYVKYSESALSVRLIIMSVAFNGSSIALGTGALFYCIGRRSSANAVPASSQGANTYAQPYRQPVQQQYRQPSAGRIEKLEELKQMYERRLISEEEYAEQRKRLLDEM